MSTDDGNPQPTGQKKFGKSQNNNGQRSPFRAYQIPENMEVVIKFGKTVAVIIDWEKLVAKLQENMKDQQIMIIATVNSRGVGIKAIYLACTYNVRGSITNCSPTKQILESTAVVIEFSKVLALLIDLEELASNLEENRQAMLFVPVGFQEKGFEKAALVMRDNLVMNNKLIMADNNGGGSNNCPNCDFAADLADNYGCACNPNDETPGFRCRCDDEGGNRYGCCPT